MPRKNHKMVDGRLLKTDKSFSDLKMSQREKIAGWLYEEYLSMYVYIKKKIDFSGTASELIEKLKSVSDETFYPNRVTRDLVRNGYTLRKYGIDFEYKRTRNCRLIILHYDRERDSSDSKNTSEVTVNRLTLKV